MKEAEPQPESQKTAPGIGVTSGMRQVLLTTEKLAKEYRSRRVVDGVSVEVGAGEIVGLLGPNGAGKTTTFNMVVGVVKPDEGWVSFQDRKITNLPMHQRARLGIGYLTQEPPIVRKRTRSSLEVPAGGIGPDADPQEQGLSIERW
jgi:ABC-type branched-subunit amino acid transport system ATPase component